MIGNLIYLTASELDITFIVGMCVRYQSDPHESHFKAIKCIIKYIHGTSHYGIWYPRHSLQLIGYSDADWREFIDHRKSTSGCCYFIGNCLVAGIGKAKLYLYLLQKPNTLLPVVDVLSCCE